MWKMAMGDWKNLGGWKNLGQAKQMQNRVVWRGIKGASKIGGIWCKYTWRMGAFLCARWRNYTKVREKKTIEYIGFYWCFCQKRRTGPCRT